MKRERTAEERKARNFSKRKNKQKRLKSTETEKKTRILPLNCAGCRVYAWPMTFNVSLVLSVSDDHYRSRGHLLDLSAAQRPGLDLG